MHNGLLWSTAKGYMGGVQVSARTRKDGNRRRLTEGSIKHGRGKTDAPIQNEQAEKTQMPSYAIILTSTGAMRPLLIAS